MVARRDLNPGDIILREKPLVTGPNLEDATKIDNSTQSVCLGCYAALHPNTYHPCRKCKAPLCGNSCEESLLQKDECAVFKQNPPAFYSTYNNGSILTPNISKVQ